MYKILFKFALLVVFVSALTPVSLLANEFAWQALRDGKAVAIMRHAIAPSGVDNSGLTHETCKDERNLSQQGRDQAVKIGDFFRANGVQEANVYSSDLCRCLDTAQLLGFDNHSLLSLINGFYPDSTNAAAQTMELKEWIKEETLQASETNILVTHGFNIRELVGVLISQGEFLIINSEGDGIETLLRVSTNSY